MVTHISLNDLDWNKNSSVLQNEFDYYNDLLTKGCFEIREGSHCKNKIVSISSFTKNSKRNDVVFKSIFRHMRNFYLDDYNR